MPAGSSCFKKFVMLDNLDVDARAKMLGRGRTDA